MTKHAGAQDARSQFMLMKSQMAPAGIPSIAGRLRAGVQWLRQHFLLTIAAPLGLVLAIAVVNVLSGHSFYPWTCHGDFAMAYMSSMYVPESGKSVKSSMSKSP
jgi:hypothetical protein